MKFEAGWRVWRLGVNPFGVPQLDPPLSNDSYTLPAHWDGKTVMARCIHGCPSPPGPDCTCGLRFYSHTGGFFDKVAVRMAGIRAAEFLRGERLLSPTVISYGTPVGPCYQDPKRGAHGSWRHYWRTGRYDVLALIGWPEYPMHELGVRYGVPTFTFETTRPPAETLRWVADRINQTTEESPA